jgi:DNA adenine methylase
MFEVMKGGPTTLPGIVPPLKWHGGKSYLAKKIVALMPPHTHYVEPFAGGLAVLLAKDPVGISEVVNDLHGGLTNFWRVLQDETDFAKFQRIAEAIPFSKREWNDSGAALDASDRVRRAVAFLVRCRQSLAGRMDCFAPLSRNRTRRGMNEQASAWLTTIEGLPAVHARLRRVVILNRPALEVIRTQDAPDTLHYCDPPYPDVTRTVPDVYEHEMTLDDHSDLLEVVQTVKGRVMISGYASRLYDSELRDWTRHEFDLPNNASGAKTKKRKREIVWCNFT